MKILLSALLFAFCVGCLPPCLGFTPIDAMIEKGYTYTHDQIEAAQDEIRKECPPNVKEVINRPREGVGGIDVQERYFKTQGAEYIDAFIPYARRMTHPLPGATDREWEERLFSAGDLETIRKYISRKTTALSHSSNPDVVALLAPRLFEEGIWPPNDGLPLSDWVFVQLEPVIERCEEFPEEVRVWQRRLLAIASPGETRLAIYKKWWLDNREALEARRWDQVRAGSLSIPGMAYSDKENPPDFEKAEETLAATPGATPPAKLTPEPTAPISVATAADASSPSAAFLWTGAAAAITLLVSLLVFWKRRPS